MYFRGNKCWQQLCTPQHYNQSTVVHQGNKVDLKFSDVPGDALFKNLSPLKFDRREGIRFTHSSSGGGFNAELETTNPAWDFQFIIPTYEVLQEYGFRALPCIESPARGRRCCRNSPTGESRWRPASSVSCFRPWGDS